MPSIIKADDGVISGKTGITTTADNSGTLEFQAISGVIEMDNVTGALALPKGTTAQRPGTSITGMQRWNTTTGSIEVYNGTAWGSVGGGGGAGAWQSVKTSGFTAVSGEAYACNTTSAAFTVTLPASPSAGNYVQLVDYAGTWSASPLTINRNGSNIQGSASNVTLSTNRQAVAFVYIDATQGWLSYSIGAGVGTYTASYFVAAGGGGGQGGQGGGGGAGGYMTGTTSISPGASYSVVIGAGGGTGAAGSNSSAFSQVAFGGGFGGQGSGSGGTQNGAGGGSGGGGGNQTSSSGSGGSGTTGQGFAGGTGNTDGATYRNGGGGGGGGAAGGSTTTSVGGAGGIGVLTSVPGTGTYYCGGGGGANSGAGGAGGGGSSGNPGSPGTANTGGGGGGSSSASVPTGGAGGSGVVIVSYTGAQRGTGGTVTSAGGLTVHTFTTSGTYVG